jgi:hypothetical protein
MERVKCDELRLLIQQVDLDSSKSKCPGNQDLGDLVSGLMIYGDAFALCCILTPCLSYTFTSSGAS